MQQIYYMTGHELNFYNAVNNFVHPTIDEWNDFYSRFTLTEIKKNKKLLSQGQVSHKIAFISKGCFRMYHYVNGEERCKDFQTEGQFTGSLYSFVSHKPALFNVAAVETSEILEINREQLNFLFDKYKVWERFGRLYMEQIFLYKEQREAALLNELAVYRYSSFLRDHPQWAQRIPLKYIASYLGIKPESLSRIRKLKEIQFH